MFLPMGRSLFLFCEHLQNALLQFPQQYDPSIFGVSSPVESFVTAVWLTTLELIIQEIVKTDDKLKAFYFRSIDIVKIP